MALKAPFRKTVRFWAGVAESPGDMNEAIRSPKASPDGSNARVELILPRRASSAHSRAFQLLSPQKGISGPGKLFYMVLVLLVVDFQPWRRQLEPKGMRFIQSILLTAHRRVLIRPLGLRYSYRASLPAYVSLKMHARGVPCVFKNENSSPSPTQPLTKPGRTLVGLQPRSSCWLNGQENITLLL